IVLRRTPTHLHGRQIGRNRIRPRRDLPRAARGMTSVRKTSSSVHRRITMPAGRATHRIVAAYRGLEKTGVPARSADQSVSGRHTVTSTGVDVATLAPP